LGWLFDQRHGAQGYNVRVKMEVIMRKIVLALAAMFLVAAPSLCLAKTPDAATAAPASVAVSSSANTVPAADPLNIKPTPGVGQPIPGAVNIEEQITDNGEFGLWMNNVLLMPLITFISLFVLGLLIYVMVRYRKSANPVPSKTSHNSVLEVVWTGIPVLILAAVFIPSFSLLRAQYKKAGPEAVTLKATGNQWFWSYTYPDNGDFEVVSNMLPDAVAKERGEPRLLGTDNRVLVPVDTQVRLLTTANDVIHAWHVPALWVQMDAVPGRINETSFKAKKIGLYYGQCNQLCGARHGFMPIALEVVSKERFAQWIHGHGGHMKGEAVAPKADAPATPATPAKIALK
jgi:cytochrome c oxidase subunit 2